MTKWIIKGSPPKTTKAIVTYETKDGNILMTKSTNSWCFVGPGLRLIYELIGPEYYMEINSLKPMLHLFFSREVSGKAGEDLVEKQSAEQGLMPVLEDESYIYGYQAENRHMVDSYLKGKNPMETWHDGLFIQKLIASLYMSAENMKKLSFPPLGLEDFVPRVGTGAYDYRTSIQGL